MKICNRIINKLVIPATRHPVFLFLTAPMIVLDRTSPLSCAVGGSAWSCWLPSSWAPCPSVTALFIWFISAAAISLAFSAGVRSLNPDIRFIRNHETPFRIVWISVPFTLKRFKDLRSKEMFWYRVFGVTLIPLSPHAFCSSSARVTIRPWFLINKSKQRLAGIAGPCVHYFYGMESMRFWVKSQRVLDNVNSSHIWFLIVRIVTTVSFIWGLMPRY